MNATLRAVLAMRATLWANLAGSAHATLLAEVRRVHAITS